MQMPKTNVTLPNVVNTATKERKKKSYTGVTIVYVGLIVYFIVIAYPLLWMIISSLKARMKSLRTAGLCRILG